MQSKVYRFEIVRALANAVYEARDPANGALVFLYEWTPAIRDRDAAKRRLEEIAESLRAEVFTADASLYVAAASEELGREALDKLRDNGLFTGAWLNEKQRVPDAVPPAAQVAPPPPPKISVRLEPLAKPESTPVRQPPGKPKRRLFLRWAVLSAIFLAAGAWLGASLWPQKADCPVQIIDNGPRQGTSQENVRLQKRLKEQETRNLNSQEELKSYAGMHLLRVRNGCSTPLRVAVRYTAYNHQKVVQGWMQIGPGATTVIAASPSPDFVVYAVSQSGEEWGSHAQTLDVTTSDFTYASNVGLQDEGKTQVNALLVRADAPSDAVNLSCNKQ